VNNSSEKPVDRDCGTAISVQYSEDAATWWIVKYQSRAQVIAANEFLMALSGYTDSWKSCRRRNNCRNSFSRNFTGEWKHVL